ncbi:pentatricopeptide repeat-containing protein [Canna indica]|uniref:Pentatricopeptide repeat-containing protein n=1 Tax=Canna indica TaxID=4628 RepID=A0AAQ3KUF2_9LILI|nr:pentatricopeptide repeat-containing protein [Canna indica]
MAYASSSRSSSLLLSPLLCTPHCIRSLPQTLESILSSCLDLRTGQAVHANAIVRGLASRPSLVAALISMYARHGSLRYAHQLLDQIPEEDPLLWNIAISAFFRAGNCRAAQQLFDRMLWPNHVTWSAVIAGYSQNRHARDALLMFRRMRREAICCPTSCNVIASVLSACTQSGDLGFGAQVHGYAVKISRYTEADAFVGASLVDMYGRCGCTRLSRLAFDSMVEKTVVAWSSLIANYVRNNDVLAAIEVFREMVHTGTEPNDVTLTTLISACSRIPCLHYGKELHGAVLKRITREPDLFASTALIDMYSKCGSLVYAQSVFYTVRHLLGSCPTPMWNALISGYMVNDSLDGALNMLRSMSQPSNVGAKLNSVTMAIALPVCSRLVLLLHGKELHCYAIKHEMDREVIVGNGLLDLYCKCGKITSARNQFGIMTEKNTISWTTLINGYGMQGDGRSAIRVFEDMVRHGNTKPDNITFVALISACSHSGLVHAGVRYFEVMTQEYGIIPTEENYGSLVDLLARSGHIDEAKKVIKNLPVEPTGNVWGALLGACRIHQNLDGAELATQHLHVLEQWGGGFQALLSNIYSEMGRRDDFVKVQRMDELDIQKRPGYSWLDSKKGSVMA